MDRLEKKKHSTSSTVIQNVIPGSSSVILNLNLNKLRYYGHYTISLRCPRPAQIYMPESISRGLKAV